MIIIDTNALVLLIVGLINPRDISKHKRLSIYSEEDFSRLLNVIGNFGRLLVLPNIWTEVDNLLNNYSGKNKSLYIQNIIELIKQSTEQYLETKSILSEHAFYDLGVTDTLILSLAKEATLLITADSKLGDYARSQGINVYDTVAVNKEIITR